MGIFHGTVPSVADICHRIAILHEGEIVELDSTERIFSAPQHPYTRKLIAALPARLRFTLQRASATASGK